VAVCVRQVAVYRGYCGDAIRALNIAATSEYKEAKWFGENMQDRRVFAPGSVSLWLNVFADTPQYAGCCDQGLASNTSASSLYAIYTGLNAGSHDAETSIRWLKAFGVQAVAVSKPGSTEAYKPFANPNKFDGVLPILWQSGGDVAYAIPQRTSSLAHIVPVSAVVTRTPANGQDTGPLIPYLQAIDDPTVAPLTFRRPPGIPHKSSAK
jgi:hypothetical protein